MNKLAIIGSVALIGAVFSGCNKAEQSAEVQKDVAAAQDTRAENIADASREGAQEINSQQQDVNAARRDVSEAASDRNYEVAMAKATGDYKVATETCEALGGSAQKTCKDQAEAMLKSAKATAEMLKPKN